MVPAGSAGIPAGSDSPWPRQPGKQVPPKGAVFAQESWGSVGPHFETGYGRLREMAFAPFHLCLDGVESVFRKRDFAEDSNEVSSFLRAGEVLLDHLREGLPLSLVPAQEIVGLHVYRDRLYRHALSSMH